jgi:hypothetical protein
MSEPAPQNISINLHDLANRYLGGLQRTFDLAAATVGSLRCQTERDYDEFSRLTRFMPSPATHAGFDGIRPQAEAWLLRNLLSDALGSLVPFLEDVRSVAALAEWKAAGSDQAKVAKIVGDDRQAFLRLGLPEKFAHLKEKFSISAANDSFIAGYLKFGQVLAKGGTVGDGDGNEGKDLVITLTAVQLQPAAPGATQQQGRLVGVPRKFAHGEKVELKKEEVLALFTTIAVFITGIMGSLQQRVQTLLPNEVPPQS